MEVSLITFNVLADVERLRPTVWHEHVPVWEERKASCVQALHHAQPSIIGLQEVMPHQFEFFHSHLLGFRAITLTDTTTQDTVLLQTLQQMFGLQTIPSPHEVVLFFRAAVFAPITTGSWWLSLTPDMPSLGFGGIFPRAVLWGH